MCAQPPLKRNDIDDLMAQNRRIIADAPEGIDEVGITGGEPTLLGDRLFDVFELVRSKYPDCAMHLLTNGRAFANKHYTNKYSSIDKLLLGIPLHADNEIDHDYITQADGSFNETMKGLYYLSEIEADIELRIVINKINYKRLNKLADFIWKNLPFVKYISFMGLEDTGYSIKHHDIVWIDPYHYKEELKEAVLNLEQWGMNVAIFNVPHCLLAPEVRDFAHKSISDWKTMYLEGCEKCSMQEQCCGLFTTSKVQSGYIGMY